LLTRWVLVLQSKGVKLTALLCLAGFQGDKIGIDVVPRGIAEFGTDFAK